MKRGCSIVDSTHSLVWTLLDSGIGPAKATTCASAPSRESSRQRLSFSVLPQDTFDLQIRFSRRNPSVGPPAARKTSSSNLGCTVSGTGLHYRPRVLSLTRVYLSQTRFESDPRVSHYVRDYSISIAKHESEGGNKELKGKNKQIKHRYTCSQCSKKYRLSYCTTK